MNIYSLYARISPLFRRRRMAWFRRTLAPQSTDRVLDIGGDPKFWANASVGARIALFNLAFSDTLRMRFPQSEFIEGDACSLPFTDRSFDIAFSNSVIEHMGTWERQQAFAREARRVGRKLWVQTPAREFFVEPHLIAPFVHWLPRKWQRRLIRNFTVRGWLTRPTPAAVDEFLAEVRLLSRAELARLFPDCEILTERFLGLPKSYIAIRHR